MKSLSNPKWIALKGILFLLLGLLSGTVLLIEHPTASVLLLLAVAVWSLCRFYYFAFYVVERWVDPSYRFSGLLSLVSHVARKRWKVGRK